MDNSLLAYFEESMRFEQGRSEHTVRAYMRDLQQFIDHVTGGKSSEFEPESISTSDVRVWLADLSREGLQAVSVKRKLQSVRAFFRYMMRSERMGYDPTSPIEMSVRRRELPRYVPEREMEQLIESDRLKASTDGESLEEMRDRLVILLLYTTGMRRSEILRLDDEDINMSRKEVLIHGKGNKERLLPLSDETISLVREYKAKRDATLSGHTDRSCSRLLRGNNGRPLPEATLAAIVKRELSGTSAGQKTPHVLRHTFATAMLNGGADINTVKTFLGHASLSTTQVYTHVSFAEMQKAYNSAHPRAGKHNCDNKGEKSESK